MSPKTMREHIPVLKHLKLELSLSENPIKCVTMILLRVKTKEVGVFKGRRGGRKESEGKKTANVWNFTQPQDWLETESG